MGDYPPFESTDEELLAYPQKAREEILLLRAWKAGREAHDSDQERIGEYAQALLKYEEDLIAREETLAATCRDAIARHAGDCTNCRRCAIAKWDGKRFPPTSQRMYLCPTCGNKRCPKATDHELACTNSNASGQAGSDYE